MAKKRPKWNQNSQIRSALRRTFSRSPIVSETLSQNKRKVPRTKKDGTPHAVPLTEFQCAICQSWVPRKDIQVDHIEPVIPIDGTFTNWEDFITRLFCDSSNLQCICSTCHHTKTQTEKKLRKLNLEA